MAFPTKKWLSRLLLVIINFIHDCLHLCRSTTLAIMVMTTTNKKNDDTIHMLLIIADGI